MKFLNTFIVAFTVVALFLITFQFFLSSPAYGATSEGDIKQEDVEFLKDYSDIERIRFYRATEWFCFDEVAADFLAEKANVGKKEKRNALEIVRFRERALSRMYGSIIQICFKPIDGIFVPNRPVFILKEHHVYESVLFLVGSKNASAFAMRGYVVKSKDSMWARINRNE